MRSPSDDEDTNHRKLPIGGLVNQVHLHGEVLAVDGVLARGMKMVLREMIGGRTHCQVCHPRCNSLECVAVVNGVSDVLVVHDPQVRGREIRSMHRP